MTTFQRLQTVLNADGYLTVSPTGYFGSLTQRALAKWQADNGVTPAVGYFGPITRAAFTTTTTTTTTTTSTTPGCSAGALFSSTTGASCTTTTTTTAGCPAGAMFNSMTGASCTTSTTTTTGNEGVLNVNLSGTPGINTNITTNTDVPVYGLQLQAQGGDVTVQRVDLDIADSIPATSGNENPGVFVNTIKVWDGSNLLATRTVGVNDFLTGTNSNDYYIRLNGFNFVVPAGQTKNLVFSVSTNAGIDNNRVLTFGPYNGGTNGIQAVSGNNVLSFYNVPTSGTRQQTFVKPGQSTLTVSTDASNPSSTTWYVDPANGTNITSATSPSATTLAFNTQSTSGDSKITEIDLTPALVVNGGTTPSSVTVYQGSNAIASAAWTTAVPAGNTYPIQFNNLNVVVPNSQTQVFTVKVDFPAGTNGDAVTTTLSRVIYQQSNGSSNTVLPGLIGNTQYAYKTTAQWQMVGQITPVAQYTTISQSQQLAGISANIVLSVTPRAQGGNMLVPQSSDFGVNTYVNGNLIGTAQVGTIATSSITGAPSVLSLNNSYQITVPVSVGSTTLSNGYNSIQFTVATATSHINGLTLVQTWLPNFSTGNLYYTK